MGGEISVNNRIDESNRNDESNRINESSRNGRNNTINGMNRVNLIDRLKWRYTLTLAILILGTVSLLSGCAKKQASGESASAAVTASSGGSAEAGATVNGSAPSKGSNQTSGRAESSEPETAAPTLPEKPEGRPVEGEAVHVICGTVKDAGMSTVTITSKAYPDGITFLKDDAATSFSEGLLLDHEITVFYSGEIKDQDTSKVAVELLRDKREGDENCQAAMISGKVLGVGMSALLIGTEDGRELGFEQNPKPVNLTEGPNEEEQVTILYSFPKGKQLEGDLVPELIRK